MLYLCVFLKLFPDLTFICFVQCKFYFILTIEVYLSKCNAYMMEHKSIMYKSIRLEYNV